MHASNTEPPTPNPYSSALLLQGWAAAIEVAHNAVTGNRNYPPTLDSDMPGEPAAQPSCELPEDYDDRAIRTLIDGVSLRCQILERDTAVLQTQTRLERLRAALLAKEPPV